MLNKSLTPRARQVLALIRRSGSASRSALIRETGLSGPAVFRATDELERLGLVRVGDTVAEGRGQPSATIHLVPDAVFSVGLALMADRAEAVLIDLSGRVRAREDVTVEGMRRAPILAHCEAFMQRELAAAGMSRDRLIGVGVAIAGFFVENGTVNPAHELDDWALVDFGAEIGARFSVPVKVENIASASAVGESLLGVGTRYPSFCYLNFASGFGSGIVVDGKLMRGRFGNAGELGGVVHSARFPPVQLASLLLQVNAQGHRFQTLKQMLACFDPAWPAVDTWLEAQLPTLQFLCESLRYVLDVDAIVLGGLMPTALGQRIIDAVHGFRRLHQDRRGQPPPAPALCMAELPAEASAPLGAAALLLSDLLAA